MKKLLVKFNKIVHYYNPDHGQGYLKSGTECAKAWESDVSFANGFIPIVEGDNVLEKLLKYIEDTLCIKVEEDTLYISRYGWVSLVTVEDANSNQILSDKVDSIENQLYICDYSIDLEIHEVTKPTAHQIYKLMPTLERG